VLLLNSILWLLVGLAAAWDISQRRIPNKLILIGLVSGITLQTQIGGLAGLGLSLLGAACGLGLLIVPFALRVLGGGDVKLTMVCGAFLGWLGAVEVTLIASVLNGILSLAIVMGSRAMLSLGRPAPSNVKLPYAVSVAVAVVLYTSEILRLF
jgi:prepilin peptidase CpaA